MVNEMEKKGYTREWATGIVAAGGTVGIVIPPSITLVVYGVITDNLHRRSVRGWFPARPAHGVCP